MAPSPPKETGFHRYVFVLLYGMDVSNITAPSQRKHWGFGKGEKQQVRKQRGSDGNDDNDDDKRKYTTHGIQDWADKMDLMVIGSNWFTAKYE
jgi:phosphatidylethanolamine-binding protein (PEBP) family uncharacterized protein